MWVFIGIAVVACAVCFIIGDIQEKKKKNSNSIPESKPEQDNIKSVTVIGTRTGEQTKIFATYNFTIYSLLVEYESGKREVIETEANSKQFNELIKYIKTDNSEETK